MCLSSECIAVVILTIMAMTAVTASLPALDEFLASSFDSDISDNEEDVEGQEDADSLGMDLRAPSHFCRVPTMRILSQRQSKSDCNIISGSRGGDPGTIAFKIQTGENLMQ